MSSWWDRLANGVLAGFFLALIASFALWLSWQSGHQVGWQDGLNEYMRQDGGVWMQVKIGDRTFSGYGR